MNVVNTVQIKFDDFLATLAQALQGASSNTVEVAFRLEPSNEFTVIDGDRRTTWQMEMQRMSNPTGTLYSLLTHILDFGDDVYAVFDEALKGDRHGWVVVVVTQDCVRAEHRNAL